MTAAPSAKLKSPAGQNSWLQNGSDPLDLDKLREDDGSLTFSDASFARDTDLRSVGGFVSMYRNGAVGWSSKGLKTKVQSTTESETAQSTIAAKEAMFERNLKTQIGLAPSHPTPLLLDSSGTYGYIRHQGAKQRTKYFDLWVAFVRDAYRLKARAPILVTTKTEVADALTKALPRGELHRFRNYMMNCS